MKIVNMRDKSLSDVARNITSILGTGKAMTTKDRNGFIIERVNEEKKLFQTIIIKKFMGSLSQDPVFAFEVEEGTAKPRKVGHSIKLKDLSVMKIHFPNVLIGEEKKILFHMEDNKGIIKEFIIKKDSYKTSIPSPDGEKPQKRLKRFKEGDVIFKKGDIGNEMYIIQKGTVGVYIEVDKGNEVEVAVFGKNNFFGEMALLGDPHRSATARAKEASDLIIIDKKLFDYQLTQIPHWFVTMFRTLMERLKQTNEMVDKLKKQLEKYEPTNKQ